MVKQEEVLLKKEHSGSAEESLESGSIMSDLKNYLEDKMI